MCGRYTLTSSDQRRLGSRFMTSLDGLDGAGLERFNVAPTQEVLTVNSGPDGERAAVMARWGLVPAWARDLNTGYRMINARAEGLLKSRAYGPLVRRQQHRCLIIADGFYEWMKAEKPKQPKQPVRFTVDGGEPFAFAGLATTREWEGAPLTSCTIVTTAANEVVEPVHDRMPVIFPGAEAEAAWLGGELTPEEAVSLCVPLDPARMAGKPANPALNKVGGARESAGLLVPAAGWAIRGTPAGRPKPRGPAAESGPFSVVPAGAWLTACGRWPGRNLDRPVPDSYRTAERCGTARSGAGFGNRAAAD